MVLFDLEATCDDKTIVIGFDNETIEIGAVKVNSQGILEEFLTFVKPRDTSITAFCTQLTTITAEDVATAPDFPEALTAFVSFIGDATILSWGDYDRKQLLKDCHRHGIAPPIWLDCHLNLKAEFAALKGLRRCGMKRALAICGLPLEEYITEELMILVISPNFICI